MRLQSKRPDTGASVRRPAAGSSASPIRWRAVQSSAVHAVGWDDAEHVYVMFAERGLYRYDGVTRQRAVAAASAPSAGRYVNERIIPYYPAWRIVGRSEHLELGAGQDG
jgi:hypothetical protein